jgi:6-phosphogluconolactonase
MLGLAVLLACSAAPGQSASDLVFVGSGRKDIQAFRFNLESGALTPLGRAAAIEHPSFMAVSSDGRRLYVISEGRGPSESGVSAFAIDAAAGKLILLNRQPSGGSGPCCVELDGAEKDALVANYGSGSLAVFPLAENGELRTMSAYIQDQGSSVNPARQKGPHAHCLVAGPGNRYVYGCDLGLDKVMIFRFDSDRGALAPAEPPFAAVTPGAGPRHIAFHPNGRWAYVINELASTITAFRLDAATGALRELQTVSTLPEGFSGGNTCAEVAVHSSGKVVYGSNRGDDSIAVFSCDAETGRLSFLQRVATGGKTPRQFEIEPAGGYLLVGNQDSDSVAVFRIDATTGRLSPTGTQVQSDNPMCVRCVRER